MPLREKCLLGGLLAVGAAVLAVALFGDQGWQEVRRLRDEKAQLQQQGEDLRRRRDALRREVLGLKGNTRVIETHAREDLGMIKQGETVFLLPEHHAPRR